MARGYTSVVREQARDETRQRIFDATVRVVREQGVHAFTIQNVAVAAGVAHRTVYRHFPTREALLEGLAGSVGAKARRGPALIPPVADWEALLKETFEQLAEDPDLIYAVHAASIALRYTLSGRAARTQGLRDRMAEAFPNLPRAEVTEAANIVRNVVSSANWLSLTSEHGMSPAAALRAATWALRTLLADLAARNAVKRASR